MTEPTELWNRIKTRINEETLLDGEQLIKIEPKILAHRVTEDDWAFAILNSQCKDANDEQQQ